MSGKAEQAFRDNPGVISEAMIDLAYSREYVGRSKIYAFISPNGSSDTYTAEISFDLERRTWLAKVFGNGEVWETEIQ
ncbi:hypothetical protein [Nitrolancea hollandica]|uniref:hypothetical protein n=1 Tax=Nitrolancea hollandica TaxID=1206749 RepID=UPI00126708CC|nr:hypothetical protein [Nitrolancea hollandica]